MLINNKYKIIEQMGCGSFGTIYKGENIRTSEKVAIKIESIQKETKLLKNESIIYQYLQNMKGIPQVKWFGKDSKNYYMVINLLGKSLQTLINRNKRFSLQLTLQIGIQVIEILETIHNKGLVHRDIKPDNFLLGLDKNSKNLYIIDFGFCRTFLKNDKHVEMKNTFGIIGSMTYTSINSHKYLEQSRRDDLESLGYMLIYFFLGELEWQNIEDSETKNIVIFEMKEKIGMNDKIPFILLNYISYVKNLRFEEKPDYSFLITIFKNEIITIKQHINKVMS
jgi:serine/threonine protein kinase